ncbi:hypothetical protein ACEPPN_010658 [Leptodophora sp. 'Broadleaf-Isolate-01']
MNIVFLNSAMTLLITYGGYSIARTPGVGFVRIYDVEIVEGAKELVEEAAFVVEVIFAAAADEAAAAALDEAAWIDENSIALVMLKPSGYLWIILPGSPGRLKGGWTGLRVRFPLPQEPTQNENTSLISIHIPSKLTFAYQVFISLAYHSNAPMPFKTAPIKSKNTVYPSQTAPI